MVHSTLLQFPFSIRSSLRRHLLPACFLVGLLWAAATLTAQPVPRPAINRQYASHWYFGHNAGLSFVGGVRQVVANGALNMEGGGAAVSDPATGNLLFYTDGVTVWDAGHVPMPNGSNLSGAQGSAQAAVIVPKPGDADIYYIFTTGGPGGATATHVSTVDMRLNGGRGDVTEKSRVLLSTGTDKIAATRHCNGRDYWVITHEWGTGRFFVYPVTSDGVESPVISTAGLAYLGSAPIQGMIQVSPNGKMVAVSNTSQASLELFDFDNANGLVANQRVLGSEDGSYYGLEFSPDNTRLYATTLLTGSAPAHLYQFNLLAGNTTAVRNSRYLLYDAQEDGGGLQLAPDGKIYISWLGRDQLGSIQNPNALRDAAAYSHNGVSLGGKTTGRGMPNIIDSDLPGVTTGFVALNISVEFDRAKAEQGQTVICRIIVCNGAASDVYRAALTLQYPIELKNLDPVPGGGPYILDTISQGGCDTLEVRFLAGGRIGPVSLCARLANVAPSFFCLVADSSCASIELIAPTDPNVVDYNYYIYTGCSGGVEDVPVLFNSRRFNDTIIDVQFEGDGADYFSYGGDSPLQFVIHPTSDQWFPVLVRRGLPGSVTAVMKLITSAGDVFRVRLITVVKPSVTPIFNIGQVLLRERTGVIDTCITITNRSGMNLFLTDSLWVHGTGTPRTVLQPLTLPRYLANGDTMRICLSIANPSLSLNDTLLISGTEATDFIPNCVHQAIAVRGIPFDSVITGVRAEGALNAVVRVVPNPIAGAGAVELLLEKGERLRVSLLNMRGEEVMVFGERPFAAGRHVLPLDAGLLPSGVYTMVIQGEEGRKTEMVRIVR